MMQHAPIYRSRFYSAGLGVALNSQSPGFFVNGLHIDNVSSYWLSITAGPRSTLIPPYNIRAKVGAIGMTSFTVTPLSTDPTTGLPITPAGSGITVLATEEPISDETGLPLYVNVTGAITATILGPVTISGAVDAAVVGDTFPNEPGIISITALGSKIPVAGALAARRSIFLQNLGADNVLLARSLLAIAGGSYIVLPPTTSARFQMNASQDIFGATAGNTVAVAYWESK
jgi:hypothetical protein